MMSLPGPLAPTSTQTIAGLYTECFAPAEPPRGIAVITHGYAEHCARYREVAHVLVNAGWAVLSYDVRGHGRSPGQRGYIDRFEIYLDDFAAMIAAARQRFGGGRLIALGHSHGGLITLRALADPRPPQVTTAILSSPFLALRLKVPRRRLLLARFVSRWLPRLSQPNELRVEDLTHDRAKQAERLGDKLCFEVATVRWYTEASAAQDYVFAHAGQIRVPTTWLVAGADPIADPARSRVVAGKITGARYHDLAGMRHEVFNETERGRVFSELVQALA